MTTMQSIKDLARQIIVYAGNTENGAKTWDDQPSAPEGGFTDRAGFVLVDKIEAYADVALPEQNSAVLRARMAKVTGEESDEHFFMVTLDFSADADSVQQAIAQRADISTDVLLGILDQESTTPQLVQVSYDTSHDNNGSLGGTRYEYSAEQFASLSEDEQVELLKTLKTTFDSIRA